MWVLLLFKKKTRKRGENKCFQYQKENKEIKGDTIQRNSRLQRNYLVDKIKTI